jgi:hypothetical protein
MQDIKNFLRRDVGEEWVIYPKMRLFIMKRRVPINSGDSLNCLVLYDIRVQEMFRGQGVFTRWLSDLESFVDRPIYINNVREKRFGDFFTRRGYHPIFVRDTINFLSRLTQRSS